MLGIILGFATIGLGAKGFTASGIPLTKANSLKGTTGMIVGIICLLLGLLFILEGTFGIAMMAIGRR